MKALVETRSVRADTQLVGNIGLYYCCYKLSLMGWNVMPTSRNARGIDIIAYSADAFRFRGIQVKTLSKRSAVPLGNSLDKIMGDYWLIINNVASSPIAFVLTPQEVRVGAKSNEKDGKMTFWLDPPRYDLPQYREAWERIGHGGLDAQQGAQADSPAFGGPAV